jgi:hypothetical protein
MRMRLERDVTRGGPGPQGECERDKSVTPHTTMGLVIDSDSMGACAGQSVRSLATGRIGWDYIEIARATRYAGPTPATHCESV